MSARTYTWKALAPGGATQSGEMVGQSQAEVAAHRPC